MIIRKPRPDENPVFTQKPPRVAKHLHAMQLHEVIVIENRPNHAVHMSVYNANKAHKPKQWTSTKGEKEDITYVKRIK